MPLRSRTVPVATTLGATRWQVSGLQPFARRGPSGAASFNHLIRPQQQTETWASRGVSVSRPEDLAKRLQTALPARERTAGPSAESLQHAVVVSGEPAALHLNFSPARGALRGANFLLANSGLVCGANTAIERCLQ